ncbi:hypothetical protein ACIPR8_06930 [Stenotrophomonas sp. LARHCG68]
MNRSLIIYGPTGCGKTEHAQALCEHFELERIVDDWNGSDPYPTHGALVLTNNGDARIAARGSYMHFGNAMRALLAGGRK